MTNPAKRMNFGMVIAVYLAGIFMGAIDTGIVTPARTVIQNNLMVDEKTGIWMITIYTLAYAASIPIMGKLADKYGRKYIYLTSIFLFGIGSLFCGLSQNFGSFSLLIAARAVQALGGGGIMPVATAEFGTTFPPEKRGMALGLVGGVYGIANIFGSSAGSAIMDAFGKNNWQLIFYINIPITLFILIAGFLFLPNNKAQTVKKTDMLGIFVLTSMVLSLLYGLKNVDYFNLGGTIGNNNVYPFLLLFVVLLPLFIWIEKKAEDPVMNLSFFTNSRILITLILSFVVGIVMMGMIFVPQFSENALKIASGSGGYFVIILGVFAGVGAPMSGRLIDKYGAKLILGLGFIISAIGAFFLILVATNYPTTLTVVVSLVLIGLGMGFTIGTPLNYMMLENTKKEESNSALATLSLVRSIGTAIAPAIMVGFLANAGANVQINVMNMFPKEISVPQLPYAQELTDSFNKLKADPNLKDKLANIDIPDLTKMTTVKINMSGKGDFKMPKELLELMKSSDVTTITKNSITFSERMFSQMTPNIISNIQSGVQKGIDEMNKVNTEMDKSGTDLEKGHKGVSEGIQGMQTAVGSQKQALTQLESLYDSYNQLASGMSPAALKAAAARYGITSYKGISPYAMKSSDIVNMIPSQIRSRIPVQALEQLKDVKTPGDLKNKIDGLKSSIKELEERIAKSQNDMLGMEKAINSINDAKIRNKEIITKMSALKEAVPGAFEIGKKNYIDNIVKSKDKIEETFQKTLNEGFKQVYLTVAISSLIALIILGFYRRTEHRSSF
ncbi:MAG: MFS transporter [Bacillota bacterium]|nr:MFS transporter [Bacillota bacterium]